MPDSSSYFLNPAPTYNLTGAPSYSLTQAGGLDGILEKDFWDSQSSRGLSASQAAGLAGSGISILGDTFSAYNGARIEKSKYQAQAWVAQLNAQYAQQQAQDAVSLGLSREALALALARTGAALGTQRAHLAASGVALDQGSALAALGDTQVIGEINAQSIRVDARRRAAQLIQQRNGELIDSAFATGAANGISPGLSALGGFVSGVGQQASQIASFATMLA